MISVSHIYWGDQHKGDENVRACEMYGGE